MKNTILNATIAKQLAEGAIAINYIDTLWILISTGLVFIMLLGLGFLYAGYIQRHSILTVFMSIMGTFAIVIVQWFCFGYSLVFSDTGTSMIGNLRFAFLTDVGLQPSPAVSTLPSNVVMIYQGLFAGLTPCLIYGAIAERGTLYSFLILVVFWTTFVYDFIAYWTWNRNGWLNKLGALDFAGGGPVHICAAFSSLAFSLMVGPRKNVNFEEVKPINLTEIFLGTLLLWFGWFGFNGGSESALNARAVNAVVCTIFAGCTGGITWVLIEMIFHRTLRISLNAFCVGCLASLVSITPACGFVRPVYAIAFGPITTAFCYAATYIKRLTNYALDDPVDAFAIHGIGGVVGSLLTGIFAENSIVKLAPEDAAIKGGWVDGHFMQFLYQLAAVSVSAAWSFVITLILVTVIYFTPLLYIRVDEEEEKEGTDSAELGEQAYEIEEKKSSQGFGGSNNFNMNQFNENQAFQQRFF